MLDHLTRLLEVSAFQGAYLKCVGDLPFVDARRDAAVPLDSRLKPKKDLFKRCIEFPSSSLQQGENYSPSLQVKKDKMELRG